MSVTETRFRILHKTSPKSYYETYRPPSHADLKRRPPGSLPFFHVFHHENDTIIQEVYKDGDVDAIMLHSISDPPPDFEEFGIYKGISLIDLNCPVKYYWAIGLLNQLQSSDSNISRNKISVRFTYSSLLDDPVKSGGIEYEDITKEYKIKAVDEIRVYFDAEHYREIKPGDKMAVDINIMRILQEASHNFPNIHRALIEVPAGSQKVTEAFHQFFHVYDGIKRGGEMSTDYGRDTLKFRSKPPETLRQRHRSNSQDQTPSASASCSNNIEVVDLLSSDEEMNEEEHQQHYQGFYKEIQIDQDGNDPGDGAGENIQEVQEDNDYDNNPEPDPSESENVIEDVDDSGSDLVIDLDRESEHSDETVLNEKYNSPAPEAPIVHKPAHSAPPAMQKTHKQSPPVPEAPIIHKSTPPANKKSPPPSVPALQKTSPPGAPAVHKAPPINKSRPIEKAPAIKKSPPIQKAPPAQKPPPQKVPAAAQKRAHSSSRAPPAIQIPFSHSPGTSASSRPAIKQMRSTKNTSLMTKKQLDAISAAESSKTGGEKTQSIKISTPTTAPSFSIFANILDSPRDISKPIETKRKTINNSNPPPPPVVSDPRRRRIGEQQKPGSSLESIVKKLKPSVLMLKPHALESSLPPPIPKFVGSALTSPPITTANSNFNAQNTDNNEQEDNVPYWRRNKPAPFATDSNVAPLGTPSYNTGTGNKNKSLLKPRYMSEPPVDPPANFGKNNDGNELIEEDWDNEDYGTSNSNSNSNSNKNNNGPVEEDWDNDPGDSNTSNANNNFKANAYKSTDNYRGNYKRADNFKTNTTTRTDLVEENWDDE